MMEETSKPMSMADALANVRCMQTTILQTEAEQKQLADQKYKDQQTKYLDTIMRQITIRSCNKYIIFELPDPPNKQRAYDMKQFAIKEICKSFDNEYCVYNVVRYKRSIGNMSPSYGCTRITINKNGDLQGKKDTMLFMLYDKRRCKGNITSEMTISSAEFDECTK